MTAHDIIAGLERVHNAVAKARIEAETLAAFEAEVAVERQMMAEENRRYATVDRSCWSPTLYRKDAEFDG